VRHSRGFVDLLASYSAAAVPGCCMGCLAERSLHAVVRCWHM
jgi:hypothetical protein